MNDKTIRELVKNHSIESIQINCNREFIKYAFDIGSEAYELNEKGMKEESKIILRDLAKNHTQEYIKLIVCVNSIFVYLHEDKLGGLKDVFEIITGRPYDENGQNESLIYIAKVLKQFMHYL